MKRLLIFLLCMMLIGCKEPVQKQIELSFDDVVKMSISNGNQRIDILHNNDVNTIKSIIDPLSDDSVMVSVNNTEVNSNDKTQEVSSNEPRLITDANLTEYALEEWAPLFETLNQLKYTVVNQQTKTDDEIVFYITMKFTDEDKGVEVHEDYTLIYNDETEILKTEDEDVKTLYKELSSVSFPQISTVYKKPIIYLYPEEETEVIVKLITSCELTTTYPNYQGQWEVTAYPSGELIVDDHHYAYLYWEGITDQTLSIDTGFVVSGEDTAVFLDEKLELMGLNYRERNDFITYWLPEMQNNSFNKIHFMQESYDQIACLDITPKPQSLIRVFMLFEGVETSVELEPQILTKAIREGFTVVDWGGAEVR